MEGDKLNTSRFVGFHGCSPHVHRVLATDSKLPLRCKSWGTRVVRERERERERQGAQAKDAVSRQGSRLSGGKKVDSDSSMAAGTTAQKIIFIIIVTINDYFFFMSRG